ncbi:MAG: response regulator [Bacteroidetes bacterium]|nr:response regulator [Bacteroidota bacterium]
MTNIVLEYLKKSVNPGGSPTRLKEWAGFILLVQVLVLYSSNVFEKGTSLELGLVLLVFIQVWTFWFVRRQRVQVQLLRWFIFTGLAIQVLAVYYTNAEIAGTLYFMVWSSIALLSERRGYVSLGFGLFLFLLIFGCLTLTVYMADNRNIAGGTSIATFISAIVLVLINFYLLYVDFVADKLKLENMQRQFQRLHMISRQMSEILSSNEPLNDLLWRITQRCIPLLDLEDFVIYLHDPIRDKLLQVESSRSVHKPGNLTIRPLEIGIGEGIVGRCFTSSKPVLIEDTRLEADYLVDDMARRSELAVPIFSEDRVVGVLDSEHSAPGYFNRFHQQVFEVIASYCGIKLTDDRAKDQIREAESARRIAEQFKELDELKNRFISNISHDLKTPLSLIRGPVQQILKNNKDAETLKFAGYIDKNTAHLQHMVEQLLQLQRLDHGLKHLYPERFQLCDIMEPLIEQFESLIERKQIHLEVKRCETLLFTDKFKLQQCIHNLLQNAFKYTPEGGMVSISSVRDERTNDLHLQICDNGPGIESEHRKKIFDRFYKTDVNNHEGTGIGLALVKEYMDMIGGRVDYSENPKGGACFTLIMDHGLLQEYEVEVTAVEENMDSSEPVILVVEDHPELNDFIASTLRGNYRVIQAYDGTQAWNKVAQDLPDMVLADLMLPGMQGDDLLGRIKENPQTAHIPVIILSSKSKVPDKVELYGLGAENYLVKPFDSDELLAIIRNCFERRKQLQSLLNERGIHVQPGLGKVEKNSWMNEVIRLIQENMDNQDLSSAYLCEQLGIGRNRLQKEIKSETGLSPAEFIRYIRLQEAKSLLESSRLNVSEVAYSVGFNNLSYFTRSFKTLFEFLPSEITRVAH